MARASTCPCMPSRYTRSAVAVQPSAWPRGRSNRSAGLGRPAEPGLPRRPYWPIRRNRCPRWDQQQASRAGPEPRLHHQDAAVGGPPATPQPAPRNRTPRLSGHPDRHERAPPPPEGGAPPRAKAMAAPASANETRRQRVGRSAVEAASSAIEIAPIRRPVAGCVSSLAEQASPNHHQAEHKPRCGPSSSALLR